jgi:hypothetical protein
MYVATVLQRRNNDQFNTIFSRRKRIGVSYPCVCQQRVNNLDWSLRNNSPLYTICLGKRALRDERSGNSIASYLAFALILLFVAYFVIRPYMCNIIDLTFDEQCCTLLHTLQLYLLTPYEGLYGSIVSIIVPLTHNEKQQFRTLPYSSSSN